MPNFRELENLLENFFPCDISSGQKAQFESAFNTFIQLNERINLVSRKDLENLAIRHFLHSLAIARAIRFEPGTRILDVGTGGGFPGIPLAIFFPEAKFTLADSIRKKVRAVEEIAQNAGLKNVQTAVQRIEDLQGQWDFVVSRAVADWDVFMPMIRGKIHCNSRNGLKNGVLYLKGGTREEEAEKMRRWGTQWQFWNIRDWFQDEWFETKMVVWLSSC